MTADRETLRFYVDESALGVGKTLEAARSDTVHVGHRLIPECPVGALDTEWIPAVSARDLVVIARDRHIGTRPGERRLLKEAELRVFWIAGKKDLSTWQWLGRLVRHWDAMEEIVRTRGAGPWFQAINEHGLSEVPLN